MNPKDPSTNSLLPVEGPIWTAYFTMAPTAGWFRPAIVQPSQSRYSSLVRWTASGGMCSYCRCVAHLARRVVGVSLIIYAYIYVQWWVGYEYSLYCRVEYI